MVSTLLPAPSWMLIELSMSALGTEAGPLIVVPLRPWIVMLTASAVRATTFDKPSPVTISRCSGPQRPSPRRPAQIAAPALQPPGDTRVSDVREETARRPVLFFQNMTTSWYLTPTKKPTWPDAPKASNHVGLLSNEAPGELPGYPLSSLPIAKGSCNAGAHCRTWPCECNRKRAGVAYTMLGVMDQAAAVEALLPPLPRKHSTAVRSPSSRRFPVTLRGFESRIELA